MDGILIILGIAALGAGFYLFTAHRRKQRRLQLATSAFTPEQNRWVTQNWALWDDLPEGLRTEI